MLLWPMNTGVYIYFQISVVFFFFFFADIYPGVELLGHTVVLVCFLWTLHTAFHSGFTSLHSFISTVYRVPFSPRSCKHVICVFFFFFMASILTAVRWGVLICLSLMISNVKNIMSLYFWSIRHIFFYKYKMQSRYISQER